MVHNARFLQSEGKYFESFKQTKLPRAKAAVLAIEKCPDKNGIYSVGIGGGTTGADNDWGTARWVVESLIQRQNKPVAVQSIEMSRNPSVTKESKFPS